MDYNDLLEFQMNTGPEDEFDSPDDEDENEDEDFEDEDEPEDLELDDPNSSNDTTNDDD